MRETRLHKRIPCDGRGILFLDGGDLDVTAVNLSRGGACLKLDFKIWEEHKFDERDTARGQLTVDGDAFNFNARICWSASSDEVAFFGIEFLEHDHEVIRDVLERLSIVEKTPTDGSFKI